MAIINVSRIVQIRDTLANVTALAGALEETILAYATDTQQLGLYTGGAWKWFGGSQIYAPISNGNPAAPIILNAPHGGVLLSQVQ